MSINRDESFLKISCGHNFWSQKEWRNSVRAESRSNWLETRKIQIKLATTSNKNGKPQDAKINSELHTKWTKTTWKNFTFTWPRIVTNFFIITPTRCTNFSASNLFYYKETTWKTIEENIRRGRNRSMNA